MKKFSKDDDAKLDELAGNLRAQWEEVESTKDALHEALERYNEQIGKYNELAGEARDFVGELESRAQDYHDERSERWQEGDAGANYTAWIDTMQVDLEDIEEINIETLGMAEDPDHAAVLDELPREPDA
jgi:hypothetical protein